MGSERKGSGKKAGEGSKWTRTASHVFAKAYHLKGNCAGINCFKLRRVGKRAKDNYCLREKKMVKRREEVGPVRETEHHSPPLSRKLKTKANKEVKKHGQGRKDGLPPGI